jgi:long-subunit acyl-CoA synthetase (AMP-forming)
MSYSEFIQHAKNIAFFLVKRGVSEKQCVGLYSVNRQEWVITEHASYMVKYAAVFLLPFTFYRGLNLSVHISMSLSSHFIVSTLNLSLPNCFKALK